MESPQKSWYAFTPMELARYIELKLSQRTQAMIGFRHVAIHVYQKLSLEGANGILKDYLDDFRKLVPESLSKVTTKKGTGH